jgi:hypothetical protein
MAVEVIEMDGVYNLVLKRNQQHSADLDVFINRHLNGGGLQVYLL